MLKLYATMRTFLTLLLLLTFSSGFSQACIGCGNSRFFAAASIQKNGVGGQLTFDYGISNFFSWGISSGYVLFSNDPTNTDNVQSNDLVIEKSDFKLRFNAHIGSAIRNNEKFDIYTGVNVGLRNIGNHTAVVYDFNKRWGVALEGVIPIYKKNLIKPNDPDYYNYYNQPVIMIGLVFYN
jgi:outer membrane protein G